MNNENNTIKVDSDIETISCDGGQDRLGHPAVYYTFNEKIKLYAVIVVKYLLKKRI